MLVRGVVAWFAFSVLLLVLAYATQADEFDTVFIGWSILFSVPIGLSAYLGALGGKNSRSFEYPSISICILSAWILGVGPSLIVEAPDSYIAFNFTPVGLGWARALFLLWCLVFTVTAGMPYDRPMQARMRTTDFWSLVGCSVAITGYLVQHGLYSNYQAASATTFVESGSFASVCKIIGTPLTTLLPALCLLAYARAPSVAIRSAAAICFAAACIALLLSTSRSAVVMGCVMCLSLSRKLGLRFRMSVMVGLLAALPIAFVLILAYRQTLMESREGATSVSAYVTTAAASTGTVARDDAARSDAVAGLSQNLRARLWYGQQFSASVDEWLDDGAAMKGSFFAGIIRSAPVWLFPAKNALADEYELEPFLIATGRFPVADLGPMPWQQWLFELGIPGLLFGALLYGWIARTIEKRLSNTRSAYEVAFWLAIFVVVCAPEHTTDALILSGRIIAAFLIGAAAIASIGGIFDRRPRVVAATHASQSGA
jgi:hypothetical protein